MDYQDRTPEQVHKDAEKQYRLQSTSALSRKAIQPFAQPQKQAIKAVENYRKKFGQYEKWRREFPNYSDEAFVTLLANVNLKAKQFLEAGQPIIPPAQIAAGDFITLFERLELNGQKKTLKQIANLFGLLKQSAGRRKRIRIPRTRSSKKRQSHKPRKTRKTHKTRQSRRTRKTRGTR